jgi:protein-disulfide isomerase
LGPEGAPVIIQVFGDFLDENTANADRAVRDAMAGRDDIRYEFRYFPFDQSCNPSLPRTGSPQGCRAAHAAEAAGHIGGHDMYWRMHDWLMTNRADFSDAALQQAAMSMGLEPMMFMAALDVPQVTDAIQSDIAITQRLGPPRMPRVHINGRLVPRWNIPGESILDRMIDEAAFGP